MSVKIRKKRLRFEEDTLSRTLSNASSISQSAKMRNGEVTNDPRKKSSSAGGILVKKVPSSSDKTIEKNDKDDKRKLKKKRREVFRPNPMWSQRKRKNKKGPKSIVSMRSRNFTSARQKRKAFEKYEKRRKSRIRELNIYPVAKYYLLKDDFKDWYYGQKVTANVEPAVIYPPLGMSYQDLISEHLENKYLYKERVALRYISERSSAAIAEDTSSLDETASVQHNFQALCREILHSITDETILDDMISELQDRKFFAVLETSPERSVIEDTSGVLKSEKFSNALKSYLKICFRINAMTSGKIRRLFCHKYYETEPQEACNLIMQVLETVVDSSDFEEFPVAIGEHVALRLSTIEFMKDKFFAKQDVRKVLNLEEEISSKRSGDSSLVLERYKYVDILDRTLIESDAFELKHPKHELSTLWLSVDFLYFLSNPRKAWLYQKSRWALSVIGVINSGLIISLINNQTDLRDELFSFTIDDAVTAEIEFVQGCVTRYVHSSLEDAKKSKKVRASGNQMTSTYFELQEYAFDSSNEQNMEEFYPLYHDMLDPSSRNYVIEQVRGLDKALDGFDVKKYSKHPFKHYIESNAYCLHLNPVIRADLHFSRRRRGVYLTSSGHCGKLFNTLIRLGEVDSIQYMIEKGINVNSKVHEGNVKEVRWEYTDEYISQREVLTKNRHGNTAEAALRSNESSWGNMYQDLIKTATSVLKGKAIRLYDTLGYEDDECIILKSRYEKISPLAVAIDRFSCDTLHNRNADITQSIIYDLVDTGAKFIRNNNDAIRALLPYLAASLLKNHGGNIFQSNTKLEMVSEAPTTTTRSRKTRARKNTVINRLLISVGIAKSMSKRRSMGAGSFDSDEGFSSYHVKRRMTNISFADNFISGVLKSGREELAVDTNKAVNPQGIDLKWIIILKVSLMYQCILSSQYEVFLLLTPYASRFADNTTRNSTIGSTAEADDIHPVTAECLYRVMEMISHELMKTTSNRYSSLLRGFIFILQQYNMLPTERQLSAVTASIISHLQNNLYHNTKHLIRQFLETKQVWNVLFDRQQHHFKGRHITSFTLHPNARKDQRLRLTKKWNTFATKIRQKLLRLLLRVQMVDTFIYLYNRDGTKPFKMSDITFDFLHSVTVREDASNLAEMIQFMQTEFKVTYQTIARPIYQHCNDRFTGFNLCAVLMDLGHFPPESFSLTFMSDVVVNNPFSLTINPNHDFDRAKDLTVVRVFLKLLGHIFRKRNYIDVKTMKHTLSFHSKLLKQILYKINDLPTNENDLVWSVGLQALRSIINERTSLIERFVESTVISNGYDLLNRQAEDLERHIRINIQRKDVKLELTYREEDNSIMVAKHEASLGKLTRQSNQSSGGSSEFDYNLDFDD